MTFATTLFVPSVKVTVPVPVSSRPPTVNATEVESAALMTWSAVSLTDSVATSVASVSSATELPVALAGFPEASVKVSEDVIGPSVRLDRSA